jgi:hypothetical protein
MLDTDYEYEHEYECVLGGKTVFFTNTSMIEFYDGDDLIMRIDPTDIGVISAIYDTVMDTWKKFDENEYY